MLYPTLSEVADHIAKHHSSFAGLPIGDVYFVLWELSKVVSSTPCVGATFPAVVVIPDIDYSINTYITINRVSGGWEVTESTKEPKC